jgi:hypothetical protein
VKVGSVDIVARAATMMEVQSCILDAFGMEIEEFVMLEDVAVGIMEILEN